MSGVIFTDEEKLQAALAAREAQREAKAAAMRALGEPPVGFFWVERSLGGGTAYALEALLPEHERRAIALAEQEAHRQAFADIEAARQREREVAARAAKLIAADDRPQPDARSALLDCLDRIEGARVEHRRTEQKAAAHAVATERLDQARAALAELEASVRSHFTAYAEYGAGTVRPSERVEERAELQRHVNAAQWQHDLSAVAYGDGLGVDVAAAVVEALEARLPALRGAVLVEAASAIGTEVARLTDELRQRYATLAALGDAIGSPMPKSAAIELPATPIGPAVTIDVRADSRAAGAWAAEMQALQIDATAVVIAPGMPSAPPADTGKWMFRRRSRRSQGCE